MLTDIYYVFLEYLGFILSVCGFVLLVAVALFLRRVPGFYRSFRAVNWPLIQGRIETADFIGFARQYLVRLGYFYSVDGVSFSGSFTQQFADEQDALDYVDQVKRQTIFVRCHPGRAAISAVRSTDQNALSISTRRSLFAQLLGGDLIKLFTDLDKTSCKFSSEWPTVRGRVESVKVTQQRESAFWYMLASYTAELGYSYSVEGCYQAGSLSKTFLTEKSASRFVEGFKDKEIVVRYSPARPEISRLRHEDQIGVVLA